MHVWISEQQLQRKKSLSSLLAKIFTKKEQSKSLITNVADIRKNAPKEKIESRIEKVDQYYNKLVPFLYSKFF